MDVYNVKYCKYGLIKYLFYNDNFKLTGDYNINIFVNKIIMYKHKNREYFSFKTR